MEIDVRKRKIEASVVIRLKTIFRNIAKDAQNIYRKNGIVDTQQLSNNYYPEFLKEIRDAMRKAVKEFGSDLREDLQRKGFNFNNENSEVKKITDPLIKDKLKQINNLLQESATFFIANESENQVKLILKTNEEEIQTAINQERLKAESQKAFPFQAIIANNLRINLLDKSEARSELIALQVVGLTESWVRQQEAEIIEDEELEIDNKVVQLKKTWIAILDGKTREAHAAADFQQVKLFEDFTVGGENLSFPRDPRGSASNIINCRCIAEYRNIFGKKSIEAKAEETFKPTEEMAKNATRGLEWRAKYGRGGTAVGVKRANQLKNKENLSLNTVKRMYSFFSRHGNYRSTHYEFRDGEPTTWRIAWELWGGDAGRTWAANIWEKYKE